MWRKRSKIQTQVHGAFPVMLAAFCVRGSQRLTGREGGRPAFREDSRVGPRHPLIPGVCKGLLLPAFSEGQARREGMLGEEYGPMAWLGGIYAHMLGAIPPAEVIR